MNYYLVKVGNETVITPTLDGYEGCEILEQGVARPRGHCERVTSPSGRRHWKIVRPEEGESVEERLTVLEEEVSRLKAQIAKLVGKDKEEK